MGKTTSLSTAWLLATAVWLFASCSYQKTEHRSKWALTQSQRDSVEFSAYHHYNVGYNFACAADSMPLLPAPEGMTLNTDYPLEDATLYEDDDFVIIEIFRKTITDTTTVDSIWLRVGSDGIPLGWVSENAMLRCATPTDPISRFMASCSRHDNGIRWVTSCLILLILAYLTFYARKHPLPLKDSMKSVYIWLFWITISSAGAALGTMTTLMPEVWRYFYFYPSLNPLGQPPMLALYISLVWLSLTLYIAIFFDLKDKMSFGRMLTTLAISATIGIWSYITLPAIKPFYLECICYAVFVMTCVWLIVRKHRKSKKNIHIDKINE